MPLIINKPVLEYFVSRNAAYMYETCAFKVSKSLQHLMSGAPTRQGHSPRSVTWRNASSAETRPGEFELKWIAPARFDGHPELHLT
jgi:hypothetical protein